MSSLSDSQLTTLRDAHRRVLDRIAIAAARSGRRAEDITLVAVTKSATIEQIDGLFSLGQIDMGENRVQQLEERIAALGSSTTSESPAPRWHMIGHLQRNKVKQVVPKVCLIHSIDSQRLANEIEQFSATRRMTTDILLQVNIAEEEQKFGLSAADAPLLALQISEMKHLRLRGVMTMAPYSDIAEESRPIFAKAAALFAELRSSLKAPACFDRLSMGMSGDYEVAIEEGANVVRVGRALFED